MRSILCFVFLSFGLNVFGQSEGYKKIDDISVFKKEFYEQSAKIHTIKSDFEQEKELSVLSEKIISKGKFFFKRDNKIRIEYQTPFYYLMIINGDELHVKDDDKETTLNVRSNKLFQQVNNIMVESVKGTIIDDKNFSVEVFENPTHYLMTMTPLDKTLKSFFDTINITADKKLFAVTGIEMNEHSGDKTTIRFLNQDLNSPVSDEVFSFN